MVVQKRYIMVLSAISIGLEGTRSAGPTCESAEALNHVFALVGVVETI
jgi:hypothetical protein